MNKRFLFLILVSLLSASMLFPLTSLKAQTFATTVDTVRALYNPTTDKTHYLVAGDVSGVEGSKYTLTIEIRNAVGATIYTYGPVIWTNGSTDKHWGMGIAGPNGGKTAHIVLEDISGKGPIITRDETFASWENPPQVPTLSEWAMIIFSVLLLGMMTYYVVRRRRTAQSVAI